MARSSGGVQVDGLNAVVRDLQRFGLDINDLKDAFQKISTEAAEAIRSETPRKSGALAGNVRGNRAKNKAVVRAGKASIPYAGVIRYGWPKRGIEANDYMGRGEQKYTPTAVTRLEQEIEQAIRRRGLNR